MTPSDAPLGQTVSHYRILERLGGGGMGVVYKAQDVKLRRPVALKFLPESLANDWAALSRFEREAQAASALNHPGICTIYEFAEHDGQPFLAMEFIEGCTLRKFCEGNCSVDSLTQLAAQAAKALAVAHAAGIVHRDIKPENMMVRSDGYLKLVDFGLARFVQASQETTLDTASMTTPGSLVGTIRYMSPEQVRAEAVSRASDIFSLGVVLYEFAAGRHPFALDSQVESLSAILSQTPPAASRLNPQVPATLDGLLRRMLEKDERLRPTAAEVERALTTKSAVSTVASSAKAADRLILPRDRERRELWNAYCGAVNGRGMLLCLCGEPGIGKTTVVETFLEELDRSNEACVIARGRCSERLAGAEAYLPLIEALENLLHGPSHASVVRAFQTLAPTWFALVATAAGSAARASGQSVTQEQLKRQLFAFLRELSLSAPVILFLDDVHWADASTIDLLAYLATKFTDVRLIVVATYRPSDLRLNQHPFLQLKLDLEARCICRDIEVGFLTIDAIKSYLAAEFPGEQFPVSFATELHARTEGNPLFLVNLVGYLRDRELIAQQEGHWVLRGDLQSAQIELPASIRSMIQRKMAELSEDDQRLLMAASVQGYEFDSEIIAAGISADPADVEDRLAILEKVHFLVRGAGETKFPNRTISCHYRFVHSLYQNAFYSALAPARRRKLSAAVAVALEQHNASEASHIAGELAALFEAARDFQRSSHYFLLAAKNAARLSAHLEAAKLARRGLEQLAGLPDDTERRQQELSLQTTLGASEFLLKGYGVCEVEQIFRRAEQLARHNQQIPQLFVILRGLCFYHGVRGAVSIWRDMCAELTELAEKSDDPGLLLLNYHLVGDLWLWMGDFTKSRELLQKGIDLYCVERDRSLPERFGAYDLLVACKMFLAHDLWYLGYPDQAVATGEEAVQWARRLNHAYSIAASSGHCAWICVLCGNAAKAHEYAQECYKVSSEFGFPFHTAHALSSRGWARSQRDEAEQGAAEIQEGIQLYEKTGAVLERPFMAILLAEALAKCGRLEESFAAIENARAGIEPNSPLFCDAELARAKGECLLSLDGNAEEAEQLFHKALDIARTQNAKSWELRGATSLGRLYASQHGEQLARETLEPVYRWFTEGFETVDLKNAHPLLESWRKCTAS
jgi:Protein kinase domain/AAA ATPase domain